MRKFLPKECQYLYDVITEYDIPKNESDKQKIGERFFLEYYHIGPKKRSEECKQLQQQLRVLEHVYQDFINQIDGFITNFGDVSVKDVSCKKCTYTVRNRIFYAVAFKEIDERI